MKKSITHRIAQAGRTEIEEWFGMVIRSIPGRTGVLVRRAILRMRLARLGRAFYSKTGVVIRGHANIHLGDSVYLMEGCGVYAEMGACWIGDHAAIGMHAIIDANDVPDRQLGALACVFVELPAASVRQHKLFRNCTLSPG